MFVNLKLKRDWHEIASIDISQVRLRYGVRLISVKLEGSNCEIDIVGLCPLLLLLLNVIIYLAIQNLQKTIIVCKRHMQVKF